MLDEADEVVVDLAGDGEHVVVGIVEDWVEYLRHFEDVIVVESWERPGQVANPLSLVVDVTSWYDEEQLRLVKGTN